MLTPRQLMLALLFVGVSVGVVSATIWLVDALREPECFVQMDMHRRVGCDFWRAELKAGRRP